MPPCSCVRRPQTIAPLSGQSSFSAEALFRPVPTLHLNGLKAVRNKHGGKLISESTFRSEMNRQSNPNSADSKETKQRKFCLQQPNDIVQLQAQPAKPARHAGCVSKPRDWCDCQVQAIVIWVVPLPLLDCTPVSPGGQFSPGQSPRVLHFQPLTLCRFWYKVAL
jgi:hypothetical protein